MSLRTKITPQEVKTAYEVTGLKPCRGDFYRPSDGAVCGLTAVCRLGSLAVPEDYLAVARMLHVDSGYVAGWIAGWDDDGFNVDRAGDVLFRQGFADGKATAALIFDREMKP